MPLLPVSRGSSRPELAAGDGLEAVWPAWFRASIADVVRHALGEAGSADAPAGQGRVEGGDAGRHRVHPRGGFLPEGEPTVSVTAPCGAADRPSGRRRSGRPARARTRRGPP